MKQNNTKTMKKQLFLISAVSILIIILFSCEKDKASEPPSGNTNKITFAYITTNSISYRSASFTCSIDILGNNSIQQHGFCWDTQENPDITKDKTELGAMSNAGEFSDDLKDLQPDTKYYIKAYITFNNFTIYSNQTTFTTNQLGSPTVTTNEVTNVLAVSAQCGGNVTANGGSDVTARGVCWSTSQNPTITDSHTTDGTGTGIYTSELTELDLNTNYYVRAYATNSVGTAYGFEKSFTTNDGIPDLTTTGITNISINSAVSGGNITDNGGFSITARGVCWNTNGNPTLENCDGFTEDGNGMGLFASHITDLDYPQQYYIVAYATNEYITAYGEIRNFETILEIGDIYAGGIVFYINGNGGGLVCAESDQSTDAEWGCYGTTIGGTSTALGTGAVNTVAIVEGCGESDIAARICDELVLNGYNDWFLPSKDELNLMYENLHVSGIGGFASDYYWSSSEDSSFNAWYQLFSNGCQYYFSKYTKIRVRAVRSF